MRIRLYSVSCQNSPKLMMYSPLVAVGLCTGRERLVISVCDSVRPIDRQSEWWIHVAAAIMPLVLVAASIGMCCAEWTD